MITLATLAEATAQEVFDQVKNHMLTQGKKAESSPGYCKYRVNGTTLKCAAGVLIGDNEYNPNFDEPDLGGGGWATLVSQNLVPSDHADLIEALQTIHDHTEVYLWRRDLEELAVRKGLVC